MKPHAKSVEELTKELDVTDIEKGLTNEEFGKRFVKYGPNELPTGEGVNYLDILLDQFKDLLVLILIVAGIISGIIGYLENDPESFVDVFAIGIVVVLNALLGFYQEISAEKAISSLKQLTISEVVVLREGERIKIPSVRHL